MELSTAANHATFSQADLEAVARITMLRLPQPALELERAARLRTLLAGATELSRVLASHTHCLLVNCQGSHGTGDLTLETTALFGALEEYARLLQELSGTYRAPCREPTDAATARAGIAPAGLEFRRAG
jgi:hypothetical protein